MKPSIIVFDVNETLSDMSPMGQRFVDVGAPAHLAKLWFATLLRDGFALTAAGDNSSFADIGAEALRGLLTGMELNQDIDPAVEHIMSGFSGLGLHPDVINGIKALRAAGYRLVTLTNGSTQLGEKMFAEAGIRNDFDLLLSVQDDGGGIGPAQPGAGLLGMRERALMVGAALEIESPLHGGTTVRLRVPLEEGMTA